MGDCGGTTAGWSASRGEPGVKAPGRRAGRAGGIWAAGGMASDGTASSPRPETGPAAAELDAPGQRSRSSRITGWARAPIPGTRRAGSAMARRRRRRHAGRPTRSRSSSRARRRRRWWCSGEGRAPLPPRRGRARRNGRAARSTSVFAARQSSTPRRPTRPQGTYFVFNTTSGSNMCPGGVSGGPGGAEDRGGQPAVPTAPGARRSPATRRPRRSRDRPTDQQHHRLVQSATPTSSRRSTATPAPVFNSTAARASVQRSRRRSRQQPDRRRRNGHLCAWSLP